MLKVFAGTMLISSVGLVGCSIGELPSDYDAASAGDDEPNAGDVAPAPVPTDTNSPAMPMMPSATDAPEPPPANEPVAPGATANALQAQALDILDKHCGSCHGASSNGAGQMSYILNVERLIETGKLVPGEPDKSPIYVRADKGSMPPASTGDRVGPDEIAVLAEWIRTSVELPAPVVDPAGPTPPEACDNAFISEDAVIQQMLTDILSIDQEERQFMRYLTLTNSYNMGLCDDDLTVERGAMKKLTNSLSTEASLHLPKVLNDSRTLYRVDIRELGWDRTIILGDGADALLFRDGWQALIDTNPYAIELNGDAIDDLEGQTGTAVPMMPVSSFVYFSARDDLYYALLNLPSNLVDLEAALGIDTAAGIENGDAVRAGFRNSGVSNQDRVIERHESPFSASRSYWKTFDFAGQEGNDNIFVSPINFGFAGGEMIFSLANGLHGYMVTDAAGARLNEAPTNVVGDPSQRDFAVRNGVSCMGCHSQGILPKVDQVRDFVANNPLEFDQVTFEAVMELYPTTQEFTDLQTADREAYLFALTRLGLPVAGSDVVSGTYLTFEKDLDLVTAAGEFKVTEDFLRASLSKLDPELQALANSKIDRDTFTGLFERSMCILHAVSDNAPANCEF